MARQRIKTTKTVTKNVSRKRKTGGNSGYVQCNMCHGSGRIKNWRNNLKDDYWMAYAMSH